MFEMLKSFLHPLFGLLIYQFNFLVHKLKVR
jgi:hypothetical protein